MSKACPEATANKAEYNSAAHVLRSLSNFEKGIRGNWKRAKPFQGGRLLLLTLDSVIPSPDRRFVHSVSVLSSCTTPSMGIHYLDFTLEGTNRIACIYAASELFVQYVKSFRKGPLLTTRLYVKM
jgi:hypothetical protein